VLLLGLLAACGAEPTGIALAIRRNALVENAANFEVRIFGAAANCQDAAGPAGNPEAYRVNDHCTPAQRDTAVSCVILKADVPSGGEIGAKTRFEGIPPGRRMVFVVATDVAGQPLGKGCESIQIEDEKEGTVVVEITDY
jgi:hypothetical protein